MGRTYRRVVPGIGLVLSVAMAVLLGMPRAIAAFTATTDTGSAVFGADVLAPVTGLGVAAGCVGGAPVVTVSWTPSVSGYADGYTVTRTNGGTTVNSGTSGPAGADEFVDATPVAGTAYTYTVRTYSTGWNSAGVSAGVTPAACPAEANLVVNPGFESWPAAWSCTPGPNGTQNGAQQNTGSYSLRLVGPSTSCVQTVPVTANVNYRLTFYARNTPGSSCGVTGRVLEQGQPRQVINSSGWLKPPGSVLGKAAGSILTVEFFNDASCTPTDTNWIDDVVLSS